MNDKKAKFENKFANFNNLLHYYGIAANSDICGGGGGGNN